MKPGTPGFDGSRLREAREARGITAISLADLIGVSRAAVSQYEGDHQSPSPAVMRRISECLNLPIQFFLSRPVAAALSGPVFYRCMSAATKSARTRAERRHSWLREITWFLARFVRFPAVKFPQFDLPDDPTKIDPEQIEGIATETRRFWGLGMGPISNVSWLLENNGAVVSRCELGAPTLDAFSEWGEADERPYVVLGNGRGSAARSRFDAAHELGHMVLHRHVSKSIILHADVFKIMEDQAHRFAGAFLFPARAFADEMCIPSLDHFRTLKAKWHISIAAMIMRAAQLSLVSEVHERRLWLNLARRKWKTKEPLDDVIEFEQPQFLRRAMEMLIQKGVVAPNELSLQLALCTRDIEELVGLEPGYLGDAERDIALVDDSPNDAHDVSILRFPGANRA